jgi:threonine dehydratase
LHGKIIADRVVSAKRGEWNDLRIVAEPGGAAPVAALIGGLYRPAPDERVGVVVSGRNTDPSQLL